MNTVKRSKLENASRKTKNFNGGLTTERILSFDKLTEQVVPRRRPIGYCVEAGPIFDGLFATLGNLASSESQ